MKYLLIILLHFTIFADVFCQSLPDTIRKKYNTAKTDAEKGKILIGFFGILSADIADVKIDKLKNQFIRDNDKVGLDYIDLFISNQSAIKGEFISSLNRAMNILAKFESRNDQYGVMVANSYIGINLSYAKDFEEAINYSKKAIPTAKTYSDTVMLSSLYNDIGTSYEQWGKPDSGLVYALQSVKYAKSLKNNDGQIYPLGTLAECYIGLQQYDNALPVLRESLLISIQAKHRFSIAWAYSDFSKIYFETNKLDSAKYFAHKTVDLASSIGYKDMVMNGYEYLYKSFDKLEKNDSAYHYLKLFLTSKEELLYNEKAKEIQTIKFKDLLRLEKAEQEQIQFKNKIRTYGMLAGLAGLSIIGFFLYCNNRQKQKNNHILQEQKDKLEQTLQTLQTTQAQLIQKEKLASLGELTAGIAHEIQNPLNFVNNFSELSVDLAKELKDEIKKPEKDWELIDDLTNDLTENQEKINHHGKRASSIVKGMLEHSRSSTGTKELTDINALADEYLRLAYHGLRAKDSSFNATLETHFDENLPKIELIPQDIGRVLLNLFNNAFYAVSQRKNLQGLQDLTGLGTIVVTTKKQNNLIEISISDNGTGMSEATKAKIFQPFFTTKPTGQGTGLGLSLAYDIITKGHGGTIEIESVEGEGTTFIVKIPI